MMEELIYLRKRYNICSVKQLDTEAEGLKTLGSQTFDRVCENAFYCIRSGRSAAAHSISFHKNHIFVCAEGMETSRKCESKKE